MIPCKANSNPNTIIRLRISPYFFKAALISILLIALYRAGVLVSIPFLNEAGIKAYFGESVYPTKSEGTFSIFMLGIMPYASSYVIIEVLSLFVPFLNRMRKAGFNGRRKLKRIALSFSIFLAIWQSNGVVNGLKEITLTDGASALKITTSFEHVLLVGLLVACFYGLVVICELITKFGIGNGISLVILSGMCGQFISRLPVHLDRYTFYGLASYFYAVIALFGLVFLAYLLLKPTVTVPVQHEKTNSPPVDYLKLNLSPSSTEPLTYASTIIMLPITIAYSFNLGTSFLDGFRPGTFWYNFVNVLIVMLFSFALGWAFLHPKRRIIKLKSWGWSIKGNDTEAAAYLLKRQFIFNMPWTLFLCLMAVVPTTLITGADVPFYIGGSSLPLVVAISLDLIGRFRFSQKTSHRPVKIAELHDIYDADMVRAHLESQGVDCHLQGYYHRKLLYFFGPIIDISLLVADQDQEKARELIRKYYNNFESVAP